jgi:hypothetical protein
MELSEEELKIISEALIKASDLSETEWVNLEKTMLENNHFSSNENANFLLQEMWDQLHGKIQNTIDRMKITGK